MRRDFWRQQRGKTRQSRGRRPEGDPLWRPAAPAGPLRDIPQIPLELPPSAAARRHAVVHWRWLHGRASVRRENAQHHAAGKRQAQGSAEPAAAPPLLHCFARPSCHHCHLPKYQQSTQHCPSKRCTPAAGSNGPFSPRGLCALVKSGQPASRTAATGRKAIFRAVPASVPSRVWQSLPFQRRDIFHRRKDEQNGQ